jgi:pimeloyl-ACP methyl ester carboxylesterase
MTEKSTWILLRGLARESGHWGPFNELFHQTFADDEILNIDLPGSGEFVNVKASTSMSGILNFVRAQAMQRTRSHSSFKLVAISLGGMVAMEWMNQKPGDLAGCVLINTSDRSLSPAYKRLRWQVWRDLGKIIATQTVREREKQLTDLLLNNEEARAQALPLWAKIGLERPTSYLNFANQLLAASRFGGLKQAVDVPVLLLNGLGDRFVDPSCSTKLHEKWGWPIERHPWGGHDLPWDDPQWVISRIDTWNKNIGSK